MLLVSALLVAAGAGRGQQTEFGFHVVRITLREPVRALKLEEVAPDIRRLLLALREAETLKAWLKGARRDARIRVGALRDEFPAL